MDGGALWGLPLALKSLALFYRTDLIAEPPRTTAELFALGARLRAEPSKYSQRYFLAYEAANFFCHAAWLHAFGGSIIPPGSALPRLDTAEQRAALEFVVAMQRRGDIPEDMTSVLVTQFFNQGRAAMVINGPWFIGEIDRGVPYGVAPLPLVSQTGRPAAALTTIEAGFLSPHGHSPQKSAEFLSYLAGPEAALVRARVGRQSITSLAVWQHPDVQRDPVLRGFYGQLNNLVYSPTHPAMRSFWDPGQQALRQGLRGVSPAAALASAQQQLDRYLRPPPATASETPYLALLTLLVLSGAAYAVVRGRQQRVLRVAWQNLGAYGYLAPAAVAMLTLTVLPMMVGAGMALFTRDGDGAWRFVGLANFTNILLCREGGCFQPLSFYFTFVVTVLWTVANVVLHVLIGGGLALLLRDPLLKLRGVYRMLLIVPWAIPNYITALIWKGMFNRQFGAINALLQSLGLQPVSFFTGFATALSANIATNVWLGFPFMMVVALGNLAQLPVEIEEAARLDGATRWQALRRVVLPILWPSMLPSILLGAVWTFNMFNVVFLVSGGEPDGATDILVSQAYRWAFSRGHRYGYAAAYAVLIFLILVAQSALMRRASDHEERE
jgi:arabinogalactan oligomer/maltooligosaccharide transport system permease protein